MISQNLEAQNLEAENLEPNVQDLRRDTMTGIS
jgi:hypothetical protein